jgi:hypothetical protein
MVDFSPDQVQAIILIVVGFIIIEGIWLAYLTFMIWKKGKAKKEPVKEAPQAEEGSEVKKEE